MERKGWAIATVAILLIVGAIGIAWLNPRLTHYIESDHFRAELEKETAKGLHFPSGQYAPIHRIGFLSATSDGFHATNGRKAMKSMDAHGIVAKFNPLGFFLRRWQLDNVHIKSGEVEIQTYAPTPEPSPAKPWFQIFLPQRVYLKLVESEPADVTWRFRGEKGGFFGTRLAITPHGRDFNYRATGGILKMALIPNLQLRDTQLLITRKLSPGNCSPFTILTYSQVGTPPATSTLKEPRARARIAASTSILISNASRLRNGCR